MNYKDYTSEWIRKQYEKIEKNPGLAQKHGEIKDFIVLIECVWSISATMSSVLEIALIIFAKSGVISFMCSTVCWFSSISKVESIHAFCTKS